MSEFLSPPADLVLVGHMTDAQGIRGLVKVKPYSKEPEALFTASSVWLVKPPAGVDFARPYKVKVAKEHSGYVVLALEECSDRDQALALKGHAVYVSRTDFPQEGEDTYYWVDLIGLPVVNLNQEPLGLVQDMMDNGAQSILCVRLPDEKEERLIPFINTVVQSVKTGPDGKIVVDWAMDW